MVQLFGHIYEEDVFIWVGKVFVVHGGRGKDKDARIKEKG